MAAIARPGVRPRVLLPALVLRLALVLLPALVLGGGLGPNAPRAASAAETPSAGAALRADLDRVLASPALKDARVSALVVRDRDAAVLYDRASARRLTPASNAKVLTAIAALSTFGPTFQFETRVDADGPPDAEGAVGTLVVRGAGDPAMNSEDWWRLAHALRQQGLRRVRGDLVMDDRAFDRVRWHPAWGRTSSRAYHAPIGALTANYGAFAVTVAPGAAPGAPVEVRIDPPVDYLKLSNGARTGSARGRASLVVDRHPDGDAEVVVVRGTLRVGSKPQTFYRSVTDPTLYAGSVLRMQLAAVGIAVDGVVRAAGDADVADHELLLFEGRPLAEVVRLFVKYSNNAVAETLVKAMGLRASGAGTWAAGSEAVRSALVGLGLDPDGFSLVDGSGLSYENRISPRLLVQALRAARNSFEFGPELVSALPIASADGTLHKRASGARGQVRAKTGLLNGTTGLSGFARMRDGEVVAFSILVNGYRSSDEGAMDAVDRFVEVLVDGRSDAAAEGGGR